jgi:flagellar export protein FliJ
MKPFRFTLEAVRTLRQRAEQRAWLHYARLVRRHFEAQDQLRQAECEAGAAWQEAQRRGAGALAALELHRLTAYARQTEQRRHDCVATVAACQSAVDEAARLCREARRQCELVETYYRKQKTNYQRDVFVEEQKILDELAKRNGSLLTGLSYEAGQDTYEQAT